jgi:hypothetical protein
MVCSANIVKDGGKKFQYCFSYYFLNAGIHITSDHCCSKFSHCWQFKKYKETCYVITRLQSILTVKKSAIKIKCFFLKEENTYKNIERGRSAISSAFILKKVNFLYLIHLKDNFSGAQARFS